MIAPVRLDVGEFDHALSPAADLDAFVNARWRAAHPVPPNRSSWDCFAILAERALQACASIAVEADRGGATRPEAARVVADLWRSGMDASTTEASSIDGLKDEFARIDALDCPADVAHYLHYRHACGDKLLYRLDVSPDFDDPTSHIARIMPADLGLPDRDDYLVTDSRANSKLHAYQAYVAGTLKRSGVADADAQAATVVALETRLAAASLGRRALARDIRLSHRRIRLDQADRLYPMLRLPALFERLECPSPTHLSMPIPTFHAAADTLLRTCPVDDWQAYLRFHTLDQQAPWLDDVSAAAHHRFHCTFLRGQTDMAPHWKRVLRAINAHVGEAMGELFAARTLSTEARRQLGALVVRLRDALGQRIARADWMSQATQSEALRKLAAVRIGIGGPAQSRDWSALQTSAHDWHGNLRAARAHKMRQAVTQLQQPVDPDAWSMLPQTVNARHDPQRNAILFPAAILQPPFFDVQADDALNFGGIGAVIAHEMTHGFDDQGSRFDAEGRLRNWWSAADRARFDARAKRLAARFDGLRPGPHTGYADTDDIPVDGQLTVGENIADFGGLATACDALQLADASGTIDDPMHDGYSRIQRFFLNWAVIWRQNLTPDERRLRLQADPHAPAPLRANAAAAELDSFTNAFGCVPGDGMWRDREDRAGLW